MKCKIIDKTNANIKVITKALKDGKIISFCPDTIYGLSANALDNVACNKVFKLKKREKKPMLCLIGKSFNLDKYVSNISPKVQLLMDKFWPGELTIIFEKKNIFADCVCCGEPTVAIRCPNDIWCQKLLEECNFPIVSTSANISGEPNLKNIDEIYNKFGDDISYIIASGQKNSLPSTIVKVVGENVVVLREGSVNVNDFLD